MRCPHDESRQPPTGLRLATSVSLLTIGLATAAAASAAVQDDASAGAARAASGNVAGRVVRDGAGVGGAEVVLLLPPPKGQDYYIGKLPLRRVKSGQNGRFAFDGLGPGRYRVWANLGG